MNALYLDKTKQCANGNIQTHSVACFVLSCLVLSCPSKQLSYSNLLCVLIRFVIIIMKMCVRVRVTEQFSVMLLSEFSGVCDDSRFCAYLCIRIFSVVFASLLLLLVLDIVFLFHVQQFSFFGGVLVCL